MLTKQKLETCQISIFISGATALAFQTTVMTCRLNLLCIEEWLTFGELEGFEIPAIEAPSSLSKCVVSDSEV